MKLHGHTALLTGINAATGVFGPRKHKFQTLLFGFFLGDPV